MVWITNAFIRVFALIESSTCVVNWVYLPTIGSFSFSEAGFAVRDWVDGEIRGGNQINPDEPQQIKKKIPRPLAPIRWPSLFLKARQKGEKYPWTRYLGQRRESLYHCCNGSARLSVPPESHFSH